LAGGQAVSPDCPGFGKVACFSIPTRLFRRPVSLARVSGSGTHLLAKVRRRLCECGFLSAGVKIRKKRHEKHKIPCFFKKKPYIMSHFARQIYKKRRCGKKDAKKKKKYLTGNNKFRTLYGWKRNNENSASKRQNCSLKIACKALSSIQGQVKLD